MRFALELLACTLFYLLGVRSGRGMLRSRVSNWIKNRNIEIKHYGVRDPSAILQSLATLIKEN